MPEDDTEEFYMHEWLAAAIVQRRWRFHKNPFESQKMDLTAGRKLKSPRDIEPMSDED